MKVQFFMCVLFLAHSSWLLSGFTKGTMIKVPTGYCEIENLKVGDWVCAVRQDGNGTVAQIDQIVSYVWHKYMNIQIDNSFIVAATGQKFYQPLIHKWIKAKHIQGGTPLLSGVDTVVYVSSACKVHEPIEVFDIKIKNVHTFCVSDRDIVVHNYALLAIGLSIAWGLSKIAFEKLLRDICCAGLALMGKNIGLDGKSEGQNWKIENVRRTFRLHEDAVDFFGLQKDEDDGPAQFLQSLSSDEFLKLCKHVYGK